MRLGNRTFPRKEGGRKSVSKSIPCKYAERFVLPPPRLLVDASPAATIPTAVWVARFVDNVNLLLVKMATYTASRGTSSSGISSAMTLRRDSSARFVKGARVMFWV